jgi:hypothetical protein
MRHLHGILSCMQIIVAAEMLESLNGESVRPEVREFLQKRARYHGRIKPSGYLEQTHFQERSRGRASAWFIPTASGFGNSSLSNSSALGRLDTTRKVGACCSEPGLKFGKFPPQPAFVSPRKGAAPQLPDQHSEVATAGNAHIHLSQAMNPPALPPEGSSREVLGLAVKGLQGMDLRGHIGKRA